MTSPPPDPSPPAGVAPRWPLDLAYLLFSALLFADVLVGGARFIDRDLLHYFYPFGEQLREAFAGRGSFLWDTGVDHGLPLAARWSPALFYPAQWLNALLRPELAVALAVLLHLQLAASATMRLALRYTACMPAAWLAGLAFACGGYLLSMIGFGPYFYANALLPLSLLAMHRLAEQQSVGRALQLAVVLALQLCCPDPQTVYYELLCCAPLLFWLRVPPGRRRAAFGAAAAAGALALALAAAQLWPAAELGALSVRAGGVDPAEAALWSLHPLRLVEWIAPGVFGGVVPDNTYWGAWLANGIGPRPWATSIHVGLAALLGALALGRADRRPALLWGGLATLFLLLAFGSYTPLERVVRLLPGADHFRYPEKHVLFVALALALLGAMGLGRLIAALRGGAAPQLARRALIAVAAVAVLLAGARAAVSIGRAGFAAWIASQAPNVDPAAAADAAAAALERALLVALALLALLALRRRLRPRLLVAGIVGVAAIDLLVAALPLRVLGSQEWLSERPAACAALPVAPNGLRPLIWRNPTLAWSGDPPGVAGPASSAERHRRWERATLKANVAAPHCARYAMGYDATPLRTHDRLTRALQVVPDRMADLLGARYLIDRPQALGGAYRQRAALPRWSIAAFQNPDALPYAHAVRQAIGARDNEQAIARVADPGFDFRESVVLETRDRLRPYPPARREVTVKRHAPGAVELAADFGAPGYLLLLESHYPGWSARLDGRDAPILRANGAFLGLAIPRGRHELSLRFAPARQRTALRISLGGLLVLLIGIGYAAWRGRRRER